MAMVGPTSLVSTTIYNGSSSSESLSVLLNTSNWPVSLGQSAVSVASSTLASGTTTTVKLQAEDQFGNKITAGGLTVAFGLGAGVGQGTFGSVTDNNDGTYTATFTGTTAGTNTITATINDNAVTSMASINVTPGAFSAATSTVSISPNSVASGTIAMVTLTAKDAAGNNTILGGLNVVFGLANGSGSQGTFSTVSDNGNGTYTATFTGTTAGAANQITGKINGQTVASSPSVTVTVGRSASPTRR
jgi:adhesin/invasin